MSNENEIEFQPHSLAQEELIFSDHDMTIALTGTQWGKSQAGTLWMQRQIFTFTDKKDNFVVASPNYKIMQQSIIPYFLHHLGAFGKYSKAEAVFTVNGGGTVYFRTETDPDSIVGIPNVKAGWLDEAGKLRLYFFENYLARAASKGARTLLTTSPYALNWLHKMYIKPHQRNELDRSRVRIIQAASWDNPHHELSNPERRKALEAQMDPRRFKMIFGGEMGQMIGLVYDCWSDDENYIEPFELPMGTRFFGGIDWGYTDPFVFTIRAITPDGMEYGISEFYKTGTTLPQQIEYVRRALKVWPVERIFCGTDQPGSIEEFNRNRLPAEPADTTKGSIRRGVDLHYDIIKTRRYKEFTGACPHAADEREVYHYPEPADLGPDDSSKEQNPVGAGDHCIAEGETVTTARGHVPIETVVAGDTVLTRAGWREVTKAWCAGEQETITLSFSNGARVTLTPDHEVFTKTRGFIEANSLMLTDTFVSEDECLRRSNSRARFTDAIRNLSRGATRYISEVAASAGAPNFFTEKFGKTSMVRSRLAATSTIETEIRSIISSQIWNAFLVGSISPNTAPSGTPGMPNNKRSTWSTFARWPLPGIDPKKAASGMSSMQRPTLEIESPTSRLASTARKSIRRSLTNLGSVVATARRTGAFIAGLMTKLGRARFARKLSRSINTLAQRLAGSSAAECWLVGVSNSDRRKVYDLSVDGQHEFLANGILVSNCLDAQRYITLGTRHIIAKTMPKIRVPESTSPFDAILKKKHSRYENYNT